MKTCDAKSFYGFGLTYMDRFNAWILQNSPAVGSESWLQSISSHVACMTVPRPICSNYVLADCCKSLTGGQADTFLLFLHSASEGVRPKKKPILSKNSTLWRNVHKFQLAQTVVIHTILIWQTPQATASNLQAMTPRGLHFVGLGVIFQFSGSYLWLWTKPRQPRQCLSKIKRVLPRNHLSRIYVRTNFLCMLLI